MTFQVAVLTQDLYRKDADNLADKHADRKYMPKQISDSNFSSALFLACRTIDCISKIFLSHIKQLCKENCFIGDFKNITLA